MARRAKKDPMKIEFLPSERFKVLRTELAKGDVGAAREIAELSSEGYNPMLVGGVPPAIAFGPRTGRRLVEYESVSKGVPTLYAALNGTDDNDALKDMRANRLCGGNAGVITADGVRAAADYREGAVIALSGLTGSSHVLAKQVYPNADGEVISYDRPNNPPFNTYHLFQTSMVARLVGNELAQGMTQWALATPLLMFARHFRSLRQADGALVFGFPHPTAVGSRWATAGQLVKGRLDGAPAALRGRAERFAPALSRGHADPSARVRLRRQLL